MNIQIQLNDGRAMNATLDEQSAPITVANFSKLIDEKFFTGTVFHRVIPNFMIQGGGLTESLEDKKCKSIKGEFKSNGVNNLIKHTKGVLSMARTQVKDSASSQFFICVADTPFLDGDYAAFGKLSDEASMQIADDISKVKTVSVGYFEDVPYTPIVIKDIIKL
ncbi:MAG: peptidylprolyl isomerase [Clostridia bacterium]